MKRLQILIFRPYFYRVFRLFEKMKGGVNNEQRRINR